MSTVEHASASLVAAFLDSVTDVAQTSKSCILTDECIFFYPQLLSKDFIKTASDNQLLIILSRIISSGGSDSNIQAIISHFDIFAGLSSALGVVSAPAETDTHRRTIHIQTGAQTLLHDLACFVSDQDLPTEYQICVAEWIQTNVSFTSSDQLFRLERAAELLFGGFSTGDGSVTTSRDYLEYLRSLNVVQLRKMLCSLGSWKDMRPQPLIRLVCKVSKVINDHELTAIKRYAQTTIKSAKQSLQEMVLSRKHELYRDYWTESKQNLLIYRYCRVMLYCPDERWKKEFCIIAICTTNSLRKRINMMRQLLVICVQNREDLMAMKLLKKMDQISGGKYVHPHADELRRSIIRRVRSLNCRECDALFPRYKTCAGCMQPMYCSRKCQKLHWNAVHRHECNRSWLQLSSVLKSTLYERI